ncbi:MAG TPA: TetR/AcrR family transcriptional regulator [Spongiibacteraceae bacterium]|nr:TetR/AcrR family transcriptional regulator [Spongiibacteraceae bacterium]
MNKINVIRARGGRPTRANTESLGQAIIKAAEALFLEKGFSNASVEAIAGMAGTSKQTIYARFGSKEGLFIAVSNALLQGRFHLTDSSGGSLREALNDVAVQSLSAMLDPKMVRLYCILTAEAARFPELAEMTDQDEMFPGRALIQTLLSDGAASGEIQCDDPHKAMLLLQDMIISRPLRAASLGLASMTAADMQQWAAYVVDHFLDGVLSVNARSQSKSSRP